MAAAIPVVRVVGPGRDVGKTWLASRLIGVLAERGYQVGAIKRSHHPVPEDRTGSDTDLFARAGAAAVVYGARDGTLTRAQAVGDVTALLPAFGASVDLVVVEGFRSDTLGAVIEIEPGPTTLVHLHTMDGRHLATRAIGDVDATADVLECALGLSALGDPPTRHAIRAAAVVHGHRCAGITLGARMALHALDILETPQGNPAMRDLTVDVETARCATDAIVAVTGCTAGSGRLTLREIGKVAATFTLGKRAVRVAVRPGLTARAVSLCCDDRLHAQDRAYRAMGIHDLLRVTEFEANAAPSVTRHSPRVICVGCGEEVAAVHTRTTPGGSACVDCVGGAEDVTDSICAEDPA